MLDLGFESKIKEIVSTLDARAASLEDHEGGRGSGSSAAAAGYGQQRRQTVLLSATLPPALGAFARALMREGAVAVGFSASMLNEEPEGGDGAPGTPGGGAAAANGDASGAGSGRAAAGGVQEETERFEIPAQLRQAFVEVPAKLRLLALIAALRARLLRRGGGGTAGGASGKAPAAKIVVFFSNCDSVEYHHALLSRCCGGGGGGGGGVDMEGEGTGGGVADLLPVAPLKLHGDLPQAERTSNMLRFSQVTVWYVFENVMVET